MRAGEVVECPFCHERAPVKKCTVSGSDLRPTGAEFRCALCGGRLGVPAEAEENALAHASSERLSALLGGETVERVAIAPGEEHGRGCRNCTNLVTSPFKLICALTMAEVDPMAECDRFAAKK